MDTKPNGKRDLVRPHMGRETNFRNCKEPGERRRRGKRKIRRKERHFLAI